MARMIVEQDLADCTPFVAEVVNTWGELLRQAMQHSMQIWVMLSWH